MKRTKFAIYRLSKNQKSKERIEKESKDYGLKNTFVITGPDYFEFLNLIIKDCKFDYALVCHDDVILPINIKERVNDCIKNADSEFGSLNWGIIGNAGIEYLSDKVIRFISDPISSLVPYFSRPIPVISIDGNTILFNLKSIKRKKITLPEELSGFHLYDFSLMVECYKKNLVCAVDPSLYVIHKSGGDQKSFNYQASQRSFKKYWMKSFINNKILTINGPVDIDNSLSYLKRGSKDRRKDFYSLVDNVLMDLAKRKEKKELTIITRTQLDKLNFLRRLLDYFRITYNYSEEYIKTKIILAINNTKLDKKGVDKTIREILIDYSDLPIECLKVKSSRKQYPRVVAIKEALKKIKNDENNFVLIVDQDDFIFPESFKKLPLVLNNKEVLVGNNECFEETWNKTEQNTFPESSKLKPNFYRTERYFNNIFADNHIPVSAAIYPIAVLRKIFNEYKLLGDYYEDYAIFFIAQNIANVRYYPIPLAGISFHGTNVVLEKERVHWDYSLTTFLSEIVNKDIVKKQEVDLVYSNEELRKDVEIIKSMVRRWRPLIKVAKVLLRSGIFKKDESNSSYEELRKDLVMMRNEARRKRLLARIARSLLKISRRTQK
ncbi:MAG: hypothetical protein GTN40_00215 [Candidatus Aenigmarchaeota archaeon]|nr:hypothetical protein [Candidatus Aenigmarchaeota archaeon]